MNIYIYFLLKYPSDDINIHLQPSFTPRIRFPLHVLYLFLSFSKTKIILPQVTVYRNLPHHVTEAAVRGFLSFMLLSQLTSFSKEAATPAHTRTEKGRKDSAAPEIWDKNQQLSFSLSSCFLYSVGAEESRIIYKALCYFCLAG